MRVNTKASGWHTAKLLLASAVLAALTTVLAAAWQQSSDRDLSSTEAVRSAVSSPAPSSQPTQETSAADTTSIAKEDVDLADSGEQNSVAQQNDPEPSSQPTVSLSPATPTPRPTTAAENPVVQSTATPTPTPRVTQTPVPTALPTIAPTVIPPTKPPTVPQITFTAGGEYAYVNGVRSGMGVLAADSTLQASAESFARYLAADCKSLSHSNISLLLGISVGGGVSQSAAENVAYNDTVAANLASFKSSPTHYANMIGDYSHVGIASVITDDPQCDGRVYTVMQFALAV